MRLTIGQRRAADRSTIPPRDRDRGFTLIETSIALLILMVALLGLASLFVHGIKYNSAAHVRTVALAVAQQRMEELRQSPFDEVVSSSAPDVQSADYHFAVTTGVSGAGNLRTITVTVTPRAGDGWARVPVVLVSQRAGTGVGTYFQ